MDAFPNMLWLAMLIDRWLAQSIATGNGYRQMRFLIYCDRKRLSVVTVYNLLWWTMSIDDGGEARAIDIL